MTLNQMIYDIKEMFNAYSDDIALSDEHIAFIIKAKRMTYLKNYMSNLKKEISMESKQQICLALVPDDLCEDDFMFLKSTIPLPSMLETSGRSNISEVYLNSRIVKWLNIIDYGRLPYLRSGRMNDKQIYVTIDPESYLIVYSKSGNHELLEEIKLNIVAEDPEEADKLSCKETTGCIDFYDKQFPIEASMISQIRTEILNELIIKYKIPVDNINDAEDNTVNKGVESNEPRRNKTSDPGNQPQN